jgi:hypothetical protein
VASSPGPTGSGAEGPSGGTPTPPPAVDVDAAMWLHVGPTSDRCRGLEAGAPPCWPQPPASPAPLSPAAAPFYPRSIAGGRLKHRRWADDDGDESDYDNDHPATYLDAVRRSAVAASPPHTRPVMGSGCGTDVGRSGPGRRRGKRRRPQPQLVCGLPHGPVDGRIPARQRLDVADRSPPPTPTGGGRSSLGWSHDLRALRLTIAATRCSLGSYRRSSTAGASTACPTRTG